MSRESEVTAVGRQTLIDGVRPITLRDRLTVMAAQPMTPKRSPTAIQKPCDHGLFDGEAESIRSSGANASRTPCAITLTIFPTLTRKETDP